jgi:hypothetical protein
MESEIANPIHRGYAVMKFVNIPEEIYPVEQIVDNPLKKIFGDKKKHKLHWQ